MELVLRSAEINLPQSIANLEALKAELIPKLEKYNNLVVTADSIKEAKADRAALNKKINTSLHIRIMIGIGVNILCG